MVYAIIAVLIMIADQGMKYWTMLKIDLDTGRVPLIDGVISLTYVRNDGIAFGIKLGEWARWVLVALAAVFALAVVFLIASRRISGAFGRVTAVMVLAGALGNGIDRAMHGWVVDMFELEFISFAVFNVADIFITVGGVLFCLYVIFHKEPVKQAAGGPRGTERQVRKPAKPPKAAPFAAQEPVEPRTKTSAFIDWTEPLPKLDGKGGVVPAEAPEFEGIIDTIPTWSPPAAPEKEAAGKSAVRHTASDDSGYSLEDILREFGGGD